VNFKKIEYLDNDNVSVSMHGIDAKFTLRVCFRVYAIHRTLATFVIYIKLMRSEFDEVRIDGYIKLKLSSTSK